MTEIQFEWDEEKDLNNQEKHNISFHEARKAFEDPKRIITKDIKHSRFEKRLYCVGKINNHIVTVRYTYRNNVIRIFGAGYWRQGRHLYEKENS